MTEGSRPNVVKFSAASPVSFDVPHATSARTVSAHPANFGVKSLSIDLITDALSKQGLKGIETIQVLPNRVELLCIKKDVRDKLLQSGMKFGSTHVNFRDPSVRFFPVTVCGLPPEITNADFRVCLNHYGDIQKDYYVYKTVGTHRVKNGNRVFHFKILKSKLPEKILVGNRVVRLMFSNKISQEFCTPVLFDQLCEQHLWSNDTAETTSENPVATDVAQPNAGIRFISAANSSTASNSSSSVRPSVPKSTSSSSYATIANPVKSASEYIEKVMQAESVEQMETNVEVAISNHPEIIADTDPPSQPVCRSRANSLSSKPGTPKASSTEQPSMKFKSDENYYYAQGKSIPKPNQAPPPSFRAFLKNI